MIDSDPGESDPLTVTLVHAPAISKIAAPIKGTLTILCCRQVILGL